MYHAKPYKCNSSFAKPLLPNSSAIKSKRVYLSVEVVYGSPIEPETFDSTNARTAATLNESLMRDNIRIKRKEKRMNRVDNKIGLVTGAARGIGRRAAECLAEAGATVVVTDIDEAGVAKTAGGIESAGGKVTDIVRVTLFVLDFKHMPAFHKVRKKIFADGRYPAATGVQVVKLGLPGLLLETEATAVIGSS